MPGMLQVEQDQAEAMPALQIADFPRIPCRRDGGIAGIAQQPLQQHDVGFQVVDDQDAGVEDVRWR